MTRQTLTIDMTRLTAGYEPSDPEHVFLGGRALSSTLVSGLVPPQCDPLGSENVLIFAPGIVTGTSGPSSGRLSVGSKSPLTGGIKESNVGGLPGQMIARLGLQAVVIKGQADLSSGPYLLLITADGAQILPAPELQGVGTYTIAEQLQDRYGRVGVIAIGPGGEHGALIAGISCNDPENGPGRLAGRGGLGAVMGSKGLKAIVIDGRDGPGVTLADPAKFDVARKTLARALNEHPSVTFSLRPLGTLGVVEMVNGSGILPTRNFHQGRFEGAGSLTGEVVREWIEKRGGAGRVGKPCNPGCVIRCSNVFARPDGSYHVAPLEYETVWAFGPNCGIDDLDAIAEMNLIANDLGIDTIDLGSSLALVMEAGWLEFGDSQGAVDLLREAYEPTERGAILMQGAAQVADYLGLERCPVVKRQAIPGYDPRALKGIGVVYASSPMGADHTCGYTLFEELQEDAPELRWSTKKAEMARMAQARTMFLDTAGYCSFISGTVDADPRIYQAMLDTVNARCGSDYSRDNVIPRALAWLRAEIAFNRAAGFTKEDDRLPTFMKNEPLPPHDATWDVPDSEIDAVFSEDS